MCVIDGNPEVPHRLLAYTLDDQRDVPLVERAAEDDASLARLTWPRMEAFAVWCVIQPMPARPTLATERAVPVTNGKTAHPPAAALASAREDLEERYVIDDSVQRGYVGNRDARTFMPSLLAHLRPGMDVLDAGCGVGAIALDLAPTIAPGRVVGIDPDAGQIDAARESAVDRAIDNAQFEIGSAYDLPFPDSSFDVVYANAVLLYLREPVRALAEMRRVLRPSGLAAISDDDLGTFVISPELAELRLAAELFERAVVHEGGNPRYSRHLRALMLEAGFSRTQGIALAPEVYGDAANTRWFADFAAGLFGAPSMVDLIVEQGWATRDELDAMIAGLLAWADRPDAFVSWLYCGALGWVD